MRIGFLKRFATASGKEQSLPPGKLGFPSIGSTVSFFRDPWVWQEERRAKHGDVYKACTAITGDAIIFTGAEAVEYALTQDGKLLEGNWPKGFFKILGKDSILFSEGQERNVVRSCVSTSVNMRHLASIVGSMGAKVIEDGLKKLAAQETFEVMPNITTILRLVAAKMVIGDREEAIQLGEMITKMGRGLFVPPVPMPGGHYSAAIKARNQTIEILTPIIEDMQQKLAADPDKSCDSFLELLVASGELDRATIIDNTLAVLFASFESTAAVFSWSLHYTAKHPEILEKVRAEYKTLIDELGENIPTPNQLAKLDYSLRVMKESQRMNPSAPMLVRRATETFNYEGFTIPKGCSVGIGIPSSHHDPEFLEAPYKFDPDRFINNPKPKGWVPFGKGQRSCVGVPMANTMYSLLWYFLCRDYDWEVTKAAEIQFIPVNQPKGFMVRIE